MLPIILQGPMKRFIQPKAQNKWPIGAWPYTQVNRSLIKSVQFGGGGDGYPPGMSLYDNGTNIFHSFEYGKKGATPYLDWIGDVGNGVTFFQLQLDSTSPAGTIAAAQSQVWQIGCWLAIRGDSTTYPTSVSVFFDELDSGGTYLGSVSAVVEASPSANMSRNVHAPKFYSANLTTVAATCAGIIPGLQFDMGISNTCRIRMYEPTAIRIS